MYCMVQNKEICTVWQICPIRWCLWYRYMLWKLTWLPIDLLGSRYAHNKWTRLCIFGSGNCLSLIWRQATNGLCDNVACRIAAILFIPKTIIQGNKYKHGIHIYKQYRILTCIGGIILLGFMCCLRICIFVNIRLISQPTIVNISQEIDTRFSMPHIPLQWVSQWFYLPYEIIHICISQYCSVITQ